MIAISYDRAGPPSVLRAVTVVTPEPGPGQIRIAVRAAGVNPVDAQNRADPTWAGLTLPHIPGYDVAGVVDTPGTEFAVGDHVMAMLPFPAGGGGYAEYAVVDESLVARIPQHVDFADAAAAPLPASTALAVLDRLALPAGATVLCLGARGGVGGYFVQLAARQGLRVVPVGRGSSGQPAHSVEAIVDLVGGGVLTANLPALRDGGAMVAIATPELDLDEVLDRNLTLHGVLVGNDGASIRTLAGLLGDGSLRSSVARRMPLREAAEAHSLLEAPDHHGKIVLTLPEPGSAA